MVRSDTVVVTATEYVPPTPPPGAVKVAEIDIDFVRLPGVGDNTIKDGSVALCNDVFWLTGFSGVLEAFNPRLKRLSWWNQRCTVDVHQVGGGTPFPWAAFIAGILVGVIAAGIIIYYVVVRPLKEALRDVAKDIREVMAEKEEALAEGLIDPTYAEALNAALEEAAAKAEAAGEEEWWEAWVKYLEPILKMLPMLLMFMLLITVISYMPRPRRD